MLRVSTHVRLHRKNGRGAVRLVASPPDGPGGWDAHLLSLATAGEKEVKEEDSGVADV